MTKVGERATHVVTFDNLDDDLPPNVREIPCLKGLERSVWCLRH
jgi:hypothetical protein